MFLLVVLLVLLSFFLEIGFLYVALAVLELVMDARLALNSQDPSASYLLSAGQPRPASTLLYNVLLLYINCAK